MPLTGWPEEIGCWAGGNCWAGDPIYPVSKCHNEYKIHQQQQDYLRALCWTLSDSVI